MIHHRSVYPWMFPCIGERNFSTIGICLQSCWFYVSLLMEIVDEFLNFFYIQVDVRKKIKMLWENTFLPISFTFRIPKIEFIFSFHLLTTNIRIYAGRIWRACHIRDEHLWSSNENVKQLCRFVRVFLSSIISVTSQLQEGVTSMKTKQILIWKSRIL